MTRLTFRESCPSRKYAGKELADYKRYKQHLITDFNERCGYADCSHFWFGGQNNFQIDHFKPTSHFPQLKTKYTNLVYACSYVNRAKSDDLGDFLDPCDIDYNDHFYRDELGNIFPKDDSPVAQYMYLKLKLYLRRNGIIWMLEQLHQKMEKLKFWIEESDDKEAKDLLVSLTLKFLDYLKYLKAFQ